MIRWFRLCAAMALLALAPGLSAAPPTEVVVVGTVHGETKAYSANDLVAILKRIRPDVVLVEKDATFFDKGFDYRNFGNGLEDTALQTYLEQVKVPLRPYDIEGRNAFYQVHDIFAREKALFEAVGAARDKGWLGSEAFALLDAARAGFQRRNDYMGSDPRRINSFECDLALADKQFAVSAAYSDILRLTPALKEYCEFWRIGEAFQVRRNQAMVTNIERWALEFQGKRLVVLCGFEHRHFLRHRLLLSEVPGLSVKEYWEYPEPAKVTAGSGR